MLERPIVTFARINLHRPKQYHLVRESLKRPAGRVTMAGAVVQYVVVRGDLLTHLGWPVGALIAQACHACTAVTHMFHDDEHMKVYLSDLDNMRKVVLQADNENSLRELSSKLDEGGVLHKLWIEQPENIPTCIAVKPHPKEEIQKYFKKFKLFSAVPSATK